VLKPGSGAIHQLITREMNDPTPVLDDLVEQGVRPRVEYLSGVIARIIGRDPHDERVMRCVASVQAQAVSYFPNPDRAAPRLRPRAPPRPRSARPPTTSPPSRSPECAPSAGRLRPGLDEAKIRA
jgi:hypothetical protein